MDLYLVRHAIAAEASPGGLDSERALTADGRARFERSVVGLGHLGLVADLCWHSPWRRAAETAQLLRPVLRAEPVAEPLLAATPGKALLTRLSKASQQETLALVGHEPWLGELAAWLCFGDSALASGLALRKGGFLWLRGEPLVGGMALEAALKPSLLRRAGRPREALEADAVEREQAD
jgi:phosphohistidine phosphatase